MTTPERLRRRQVRNDWYIAGLALLLLAAFLYFQGQAAAQKRCLTNFISTSSQTTAIRAKLYDRDRRTTKDFLLDATDPTKVKTRQEFLRVRDTYARSLRAIDAERAANPVQTLPKGVCD